MNDQSVFGTLGKEFPRQLIRRKKWLHTRIRSAECKSEATEAAGQAEREGRRQSAFESEPDADFPPFGAQMPEWKTDLRSEALEFEIAGAETGGPRD